MDRRNWIVNASVAAACGLVVGCKGYQYAHVIKPEAENMVGSHEAGAEVFDPLVDEASPNSWDAK